MKGLQMAKEPLRNPNTSNQGNVYQNYYAALIKVQEFDNVEPTISGGDSNCKPDRKCYKGCRQLSQGLGVRKHFLP